MFLREAMQEWGGRFCRLLSSQCPSWGRRFSKFLVANSGWHNDTCFHSIAVFHSDWVNETSCNHANDYRMFLYRWPSKYFRCPKYDKCFMFVYHDVASDFVTDIQAPQPRNCYQPEFWDYKGPGNHQYHWLLTTFSPFEHFAVWSHQCQTGCDGWTVAACLGDQCHELGCGSGQHQGEP